MARPIYVETLIRAPLDDVWKHTQTPHVHERWDLRFSTIDYLPRESDNQPQRFRYETRIGFGMAITGTGETTGERLDCNGRVSALRFESGDPKSLIREGSGYWKYLPQEDGVRFLTLYDYRTRFAAPGRVVDALLFRPLLGWATAWSFDRLRLWIERGVDPAMAADRAIIDATARLTLAFIWLFQGLVPKLLLPHPREISLAKAVASGITDQSRSLVTIAGIVEVLLGIGMILFWRSRAVYAASAAAAALVTIPALFTTPSLFVEPFNPTTLVAGMLALSLIGHWACHDLPSARRCLRRPPREEP